ncbi:GNAT domain [Dillenia turbinata]|uniref:GNAT domain n=1 Tax=Dillenia turbinata TaxID=194707 RepID=A0AAN8UEF8_9MAGN
MEIILRPYDFSDVDDFIKWADDEEVIKPSRLRHFSSREDALNYMKDNIMPHPWYRAICLSDNRPIGFIAVVPGSGPNICRGRISYALGSKYWGQGITTMAVKKVVSSVFQEFPNIERLETIVDVQNEASQKVLEKVGFAREGVLRRYCFDNVGNIADVQRSGRHLLATLMLNLDRHGSSQWNGLPKASQPMVSNSEIGPKVDIFVLQDLFDKGELHFVFFNLSCKQMEMSTTTKITLRQFRLADDFMSDDSSKAEIGYALGAKYWGKWIIPKALKMAMSMVFKEFPKFGEAASREQGISKGLGQNWISKSGVFDELQDLVRIQAYVEEVKRRVSKSARESWVSKGRFLRKFGFNKEAQFEVLEKWAYAIFALFHFLRIRLLLPTFSRWPSNVKIREASLDLEFALDFVSE